MRYDGVGMGGAGGSIVILVIMALAAFLALSLLHKQWPRLVELSIGGLTSLVVGSIRLLIFGLVVLAISVPVAGALDLDRGGQLITLPIIAAALYLIGVKMK